MSCTGFIDISLPPSENNDSNEEIIESFPSISYFSYGGRSYLNFQKCEMEGFKKEKKSGKNDQKKSIGNKDGFQSFLAKIEEQEIIRSNRTLGKFKKDDDHYKILGLEHLRWKSTPEQIKKQFRLKCKEHHPDLLTNKTSEDEGKKNEEDNDVMFKKVTAAYELLKDPKKRLVYDSSFYFDSSIPSDVESVINKLSEVENANEVKEDDPKRKELEKKFYQTLNKAFAKWSKWSSSKRKTKVSQLGDENSSWEEVDQFYQFWRYQFRSWRDFSFLKKKNVYDVSEAESRVERRWMEKENEKVCKKHQKEEREALNKLIQICYDHDPRVLSHKREEQRILREEKENRERKKREKREAKERKKKEEEERLQKAEEEKRMKEEAEKEKKKEMKRVEKEKKRKAEKELREVLSSSSSKDFIVFNRKEFLKKRKQKEPCVLSEYFEFVLIKCKSKELVQCLKKLKQHFQKKEMFLGCDLINKAAEQLIEKDKKKKEKMKKDRKKELENRNKGGDNSKWSKAELRVLMDCLVRFPSGTPNRFEVISQKFQGKKTAKEIQKKSIQLRREKPKNFTQKTSFSTIEEEEKQKNVWSNEQQKQFESALRSYLRSSDKYKWEKIASMVEGKSEEECKLHFEKCKEIARKAREKRNK